MTAKRQPSGANGVIDVNAKAKKNGKKRHTIKRPDGPEHVALVALGPSALIYNRQAEMSGGRRHFCDAVWTVNTYGDVLQHDLLWHMDDVRIQEIRARANPDGKMAKMISWMKTHDKPIMTSRAHPDYPATVDFPLEDVINALGIPYFNGTTSYAIAYAIYIGVKELSLFGFDFSYPNAHHAEKGRACCEFWAGQAMARGLQVRAPDMSTFMDANLPFADRFYGYDAVDVNLEMKNGKAKINFTDRETLPTAEEMEDRYDHTKHPTMRHLPATPELGQAKSEEVGA